MNILIYFGNQIYAPNGGTERVASLIAKNFIQRGNKVIFLACHRNKDGKGYETLYLPDEKESPTQNNIEFLKYIILKHDIDIIINEGAYGESANLISHQYISENIRIISHFHFDPVGGDNTFYKSLYLPIPADTIRQSILNGLKWIKAPYNRYKSFKNKKKRFKYLHKNSDIIVFLNKYHSNSFKKIVQLKDITRHRIIKNPLSFKPQNKIFEKQNTILFVGRLDYSSKRIDRILEIWARLHLLFPKWDLKIVGDGPDRKHLESLAATLKLSNIKFIGSTDSEPLYKNSKILIMTSNYEGSPMVIPEAMTYGVVPVIMNNFSGARDFIENNYNGILTKSFNINDMVRNIKALIENESFWVKLSNNGIKTIQDFNNNSIFDDWNKLISVNE